MTDLLPAPGAGSLAPGNRVPAAPQRLSALDDLVRNLAVEAAAQDSGGLRRRPGLLVDVLRRPRSRPAGRRHSSRRRLPAAVRRIRRSPPRGSTGQPTLTSAASTSPARLRESGLTMTHRGRCAGGDTVADPLGGRRHRADLPGAGRVPAQRDLDSERGLLGIDERARPLLPSPAAAARPVHDATPGSDGKSATHAVRSASPRAHRTPTPAPVQRMDRPEAGEPAEGPAPVGGETPPARQLVGNRG